MSLDSRSDELDKKLQDNDIDNIVSTLVKDAKRRRRHVRLLAISIILDFVLSISISVILVKTIEVTRLSQSNKEAVILNCETANDSRSNQRQLWGYVLSLTPPQPRSLEQQDRIKEFAKFVDMTFSTRDCQAEANR